MESNIEFKYNGKVYQSVSEQWPNSCLGCAFMHLSHECVDTSSTFKCSSNKVIWQEKPAGSTELTWTEQEIREAYFDWTGDLGNLIEILKNRKDPEYHKYLELKAKFGE